MLVRKLIVISPRLRPPKLCFRAKASFTSTTLFRSQIKYGELRRARPDRVSESNRRVFQSDPPVFKSNGLKAFLFLSLQSVTKNFRPSQWSLVRLQMGSGTLSQSNTEKVVRFHIQCLKSNFKTCISIKKSSKFYYVSNG